MADAPRLIVLRGNSASGKSSLAAALQRALGRGVANIGQDHFRRVVLREHDVPEADNIGLIEHTVRYCTRIGYHVILEGILRSDHYGSMLCDLVAEHAGPTHVFYLNVSLEETLRRHETRPLRAEVPPHNLRQWFVPSDTLGVPDEIVLDGSAEFDTTRDAILATIGTLPSRPDLDAARYL